MGQVINGTSLEWNIEDGILSIQGSGVIPDYDNELIPPWYDEISNIISIDISENVTAVGKYAFANCYKVTEVILPSTLKIIDEWSFAGCILLSTVSIPDTVTTIGSYAFYWCPSLTTVTIPQKTSFIGTAPFGQCENLLSIEVPLENTSYYDSDGILHSSDSNLIQFPCAKRQNAINFISGNKINEAAYAGSKYITSLDFYGVTEIEEAAFVGMEKLIDIYINKDIEFIGDYAFSACPKLRYIGVNSDNTHYADENDSVLFELKNGEKDKIIQYCIGKTDNSYTIPESVTTIGVGSFAGSTKLETISGLNNISKIDTAAFLSCDAIKNLTIPVSEIAIELQQNAFNSCDSLKTVSIYNELKDNTIPEYIFVYCRNLTDVTFTNKITVIKNSSFSNCTNLSDVYYKGSTYEKQTFMTIESDEDSNEDLINAFWYYDQISVNSIELSSNYIKTEAGETLKITATILPQNASSTTVIIWESSDPTVATVSNGVIRTLKPGRAFITARVMEGEYYTYEAICQISVDISRSVILKAIKRSQQIRKYRICVLNQDETVAYEIPEEDIVYGSISVNENLQNGQRRELSFDLYNTDGKYTPTVNSQIGYYQVFYSSALNKEYNKYQKNLTHVTAPLWGVVRFSLEVGFEIEDETYWFKKGVYILNSISMSPLSSENTVSIKSKDKYSLLEGSTGKLLVPYQISPGANIHMVLKDLLRTDMGNGSLIDIQKIIIHPSLLNAEVGASIKKEAGDNISSLISDLATQANAEYYYNENGNFIFYPIEDALIDERKPICYTINNIEEILDFSVEYNWEETINMIKVVGNNVDSDLYQALAVNNDPRSPISVSNIGKRLGDVVTDANVYSDSLALDLARYKLRKNSLDCLLVSLVTTFNPLIELDQLIKVEIDDDRVEDATFIVKSISHSDKSNEMSIGTTNIQNLTFLLAGDEGYDY